MFKKIAEFFTGKKPEEPKAECPYKAEPGPSNVQAEGTVESPAPAVEAVVVVSEAIPLNLVADTISTEVAPVEPAPTKKPRAPAKPKAAKPAVVKAPPALKKPRAPKAK
jgi:hypothetical protein